VDLQTLATVFTNNHMPSIVLKNKEDVLAYLREQIVYESTVAVGGSTTLFQFGIIDELRSRNLNFYDRYAPGLTPAQIQEVFHHSFNADAYIASANAVTQQGEIVNIDRTGNRVAAMMYGPKKVYLIVSASKVVKDLDEARERIRSVAAPKNAHRLNLKTPCVQTGHCMDCESPDRLCAFETVIKRQAIKDRIHVILVEEQGGF